MPQRDYYLPGAIDRRASPFGFVQLAYLPVDAEPVDTDTPDDPAPDPLMSTFWMLVTGGGCPIASDGCPTFGS
jgi:hypothetical protein